MTVRVSGRDDDLADVGLVGLAVMGQNLALNIADSGYSIAVHNRTAATAAEFAAGAEPGQDIRASTGVEDFVAGLARPRKILLLVKAGEPVDAVIGQLLPHLASGDIIVDCGNSLFTDSERRTADLQAHGVRFVGAGVSGGEEGARHGPSIMPGGDVTAWPEIEPILEAVAATAGPNDDEPCCAWLGGGGAGHYVKMVHNGIEYGDMQVLAEALMVLRATGLKPDEVAAVFKKWNQGRLQSYLVEITAEILAATDDDGTPMVDVILDAAGQKGTGKWTVISAMELGQPVMLVGEAVGARMVSSLVETRATASDLLGGPGTIFPSGATEAQVEAAVYGAKLISYAQGFMLLAEASRTYRWSLDLATVARLWRGGCIIRASFLDDIAAAYSSDGDLENLLFDPVFADRITEAQAGLRQTVVAAATAGVATPALSSALAFYDGFRTARGSAALIQAQRDYFGAHTFERVDEPRGQWFHRDWAATGARAVSGSYSQ